MAEQENKPIDSASSASSSEKSSFAAAQERLANIKANANKARELREKFSKEGLKRAAKEKAKKEAKKAAKKLVEKAAARLVLTTAVSTVGVGGCGIILSVLVVFIVLFSVIPGSSSTGTTPSGTTEPASGSDIGSCEAGTDVGTGEGYQNGSPQTIRLCSIQGIVTVNSQISLNIDRLLTDSKNDGIVFGGWGFRTMERQIELRKEHCGTSHYDVYEKPSSQCRPPTARPGYSNHQMGLAIDFTQNGHTISGSSTGFTWLNQNAATYGLYNLPSETWHWSVNGN